MTRGGIGYLQESYGRPPRETYNITWTTFISKLRYSELRIAQTPNGTLVFGLLLLGLFQFRLFWTDWHSSSLWGNRALKIGQGGAICAGCGGMTNDSEPIFVRRWYVPLRARLTSFATFGRAGPAEFEFAADVAHVALKRKGYGVSQAGRKHVDRGWGVSQRKE